MPSDRSIKPGDWLRRIATFVKTHVVLLVFNAIAINLALSAWNYYDVRYFIRWYEEYFINGRLLYIYGAPPDLKVAYPPLAVILFVVFHWIGSIVSSDIVIIRFIDKIPLLILFNLVYFILRKRFGAFASYLWLLNASVYAIIYGYQFDLYNVLFLLLALLSIEKGDYIKYGIFVTLSAMIKHTTGIVALIPIIELLRNKNRRALFSYIKAVLAISIPIILPFFIVAPMGFIDKVLLFHARRPPQYLSIWAIPIYLTNYEYVYNIPWFYDKLWLISYLVYMAVIVRLAWKDRELPRLYYYAKYQVLMLIGLLIFGKVGNAIYLTWITPGLIVLMTDICKRDRLIGRKLTTLYVFISFLAVYVLNLAIFIAPLVAGYPIFIFEDMVWMPTEVLLKYSIGTYPFDYQYLLASFLRTMPWMREICRAISLSQGYVVALVISIYILVLSYFAYVVSRYPNIASK